MDMDPPNEFFVDPYAITPEQVEQFFRLIFSNSNEKPIDEFLRQNLSILAFISVFFSAGHQGAWIVPQQLIKPRVGKNKGLKPDYLFAGANSDGVTWWVLELKGANEAIVTKDKNGTYRFSSVANEGVIQLNQYLDYCSINQGLIRDAYGINSFTEPKGILLIGRAREFENNEHKRNIKRRHNQMTPNLQIRTYDALITAIKNAGQINSKLPWLQKQLIDLFMNDRTR